MNTPLDRIVATDQRFKALEKAAKNAYHAMVEHGNAYSGHHAEYNQAINELRDALSSK